MASANPCSVLQGLANWEYQIIRSLNKKFAALQRLAELLEQLGDISSFLPTVSQLVPVIDIDISTYNNLAVNCPFLNLPPANIENLNELKARLNAAYGQLLGKILNHPWIRMDRVQAMLNEFQAKINYPYGNDYLRCLNSVCAAVNAAGSLLDKISQTNIDKELADFSKNFVDNAGQVLSKGAQVKRDEAVQVYNQVLDLKDDTVQDYRSLTVTGDVKPASPPLNTGHATVPDYEFLPDMTFRFPDNAA
jgi:hypothetical protein